MNVCWIISHDAIYIYLPPTLNLSARPLIRRRRLRLHLRHYRIRLLTLRLQAAVRGIDSRQQSLLA